MERGEGRGSSSELQEPLQLPGNLFRSGGSIRLGLPNLRY